MNMSELKRLIISIEIKALEKTIVDGEGKSHFVDLIRGRIDHLRREADWIHPFDKELPVSRPAMTNLVIRDAAIDDVDMIRDVYRRSSLTNETDHDLIAANPEWLVWDEALLPFAHVAVVDGRIVGFATARPVDDFLELEDLFTDPDWMRQGVASALIADIAQRGVRIEVSANLAKAFYESAGFVVIGVADSPGGPLLRMHREVSKP
ncbi:GNAT family N-acetyltransferase [Paenibacillus sp. BC26]|uniref:GNAT family N-acetyltransferase n=1 Tax=Paenibacillus sp. BC26 TaxID=1881032 RepID=UPI0008E0648D|nr:GNAT family N-acetyltransferase [Paenibacillus sp. BC26]SFS63920.1 Ribosomal protein S18 acetylase RimI [Paenibacillus sp. BC26]